MEQFVEAFKQTTITDECEFLRGPEGAQITCHPDSFGIEITTEKNFEGVLFVEDHFDDPKCKLQTNSTDFELRVELLNCGVHRQFLVTDHYALHSQCPLFRSTQEGLHSLQRSSYNSIQCLPHHSIVGLMCIVSTKISKFPIDDINIFLFTSKRSKCTRLAAD